MLKIAILGINIIVAAVVQLIKTSNMYKITVELTEEKILMMQTTLKALEDEVEQKHSAINSPYERTQMSEYFSSLARHAGYRRALYDILGRDLYNIVSIPTNGNCTCVDLNEEPMDKCYPESTSPEIIVGKG